MTGPSQYSANARLPASSADVAPRIAILAGVLATYRQGFYDRLFARDDVLVDVYCQDHIRRVNLKSIHARYPDRVRIVKGFSLGKERFVWQCLPWRRVLFDYDVVFVEGNPRVAPHAIAGTLLRLLGRNVVLWTMAHSFAASRVTEWLRLSWSRCFNNVFLYTDAEVIALRKLGFNRQELGAMNNGLDQALIDRISAQWSTQRLDVWRSESGLKGQRVLLSCARLQPKNRFDLLLSALETVVHDVPNVVWCIVGDGQERDRLAQAASRRGIRDRIRFLGEIYDESDLAPWFLTAELLVHPGAIGLSIMHALGYGLPVVTHGSAAHHCPEFGAFEEGRTGRTFRENDATSLAATIVQLLGDDVARSAMSERALDIARHSYNVDVMVDRFVEFGKRVAAQKG